MAFDITLEGNYIYVTNNGTTVLDRPSSEVFFAKKDESSTDFTIYHDNDCVTGFQEIEWDEFTLDGVAFVDQQAFEDWKNENTGIGSQSPDSGGVTPTPPPPAQGIISSTRATLDGNVPAGAKVVSLVFRGNDGTLNGSLVPNGYAKEWLYPNGEDLPQIDYTVPTSGGGGAANRGIYIDVSL